MPPIRRPRSWLPLVVITLALIACQPPQAGTPSRPDADTDADQRAEPVTVVDARGQTVELPAPAERVATIPMPSAAILTAVDGGAERLVGMHPASMAALEQGILSDIYPTALEADTGFIESGFTPNVEQLLTLGPDAVFQWADRGADLIAPMESAGLRIIGVEYGTRDDLAALVRMKGRAIGKPARAEEITAYHDATVADLRAQAAEIADDERARVLYFLRFAERLRVSGRETFNDFYIDLVGGRNVAADGQPAGHYEISAEQVLAWDPEVILLGGFDDAVPADVYEDPLLADVSAVRARRVYKVPLGGYRWDPPSHESPLMYMWLAELLHPETFTVDVRAAMRDRYAWLYGHALSDEEIDRVLRADLNADAAGYGPLLAR